MMGRFRNSILLVVAVATAFVFYGIFFDKTTMPKVTFVSLKGERIAADSLRGKVVLVNFWATDCATCIKEMPDMVKIYNAYRTRGFELIAVAMQYDPPNRVIRYTEKNALPFTVALDPVGELARSFGDVRLTPTTFVINKRGNIVSRIIGEPDFSGLHELIEKNLTKEAS